MLANWAVSLSDRAECVGSKSRPLQQHLFGIDGIDCEAPPTASRRKSHFPSCARACATWIEHAGRLGWRSMSFLQVCGRVGAESGGNQQHNCPGRSRRDVQAVVLLFQDGAMDLAIDRNGI